MTGQSSGAEAQCDQLGREELSAVVVCPPGLGENELHEAGKHACAAPGSCHAWIWDDPKQAPKGPITHLNPMTDAQLESAVALWVDYTRTLYVCGEALC